jgi:hypothetical protein|tara:strand:- start:705 stop:1082 length:378 start_codon:yes stop_codon:yes gene_type:complete
MDNTNEDANEDLNDCIISLFSKCGIVCSNIHELDGMTIPRVFLLDNARYMEVQENIVVLKTLLSSSLLTSLQSSASDKQKWPLLNLVRQILKSQGYALQPKRLCDGYDATKKKKYKRVFLIKKSP